MIKKLATGFLAVAATGALALSLPAAAQAATAASSAPTSSADYASYWSATGKYGLAKAQGWIGVEGEYDHDNTVHVKGRLYDLDNRSYKQGGQCAYVKFQAGDDEYDWNTVYVKKYCGYPGYKAFHFSEDDVYAMRVKVCQWNPFDHYTTKCGKWTYLYDEGEM
ncbi:hypothetical protein [Nonomuraea sp. NPDC046570]|uniref:hypothetical protein n=1 Tax=Nonomuraea sp. NPDC046570 TaxID=3155255 RepID=UPI0033CAC2C4